MNPGAVNRSGPLPSMDIAPELENTVELSTWNDHQPRCARTLQSLHHPSQKRQNCEISCQPREDSSVLSQISCIKTVWVRWSRWPPSPLPRTLRWCLKQTKVACKHLNKQSSRKSKCILGSSPHALRDFWWWFGQMALISVAQEISTRLALLV